MNIPIVAIIGLPNSGKSTFFNKVLEVKKALTYPVAGTTRDRAYGLTTWNGLQFHLVDTAGIVLNPNSDLEKNIQRQTRIALEEADLILLVVDGRTLPSQQDQVIAQQLKRSKKPVVLSVNKIEVRNAKTEEAGENYRKLGLGELFMMSSLNGSGVGDVLDEIVTKLKPKFGDQNIEESLDLKLAFVGKPNVGKSSLINALLKQDRLIVHDAAGTTRSTVEIPFEYEQEKYILLDTAGIKRKWKQDVDVEAAAAFQSLRTISRIDVALFVIDASQDITVQDQVVMDEILDQNKSVVMVLNKIDLLSEEERQKLLDRLPHYFPQLWWAPVVFTSANNGQGLDLILKFAMENSKKDAMEISQEELDLFMEKMTKNHMPGKMDDQREPKFYNIKQVGIKPPTFKLTVNFPAAIAESWKRFFEKQFRLKFGFEGAAVVIKYVRKQ